jgi:hypothetical protein
MCETDWASLDNLQDETVTTILKVMSIANGLRRRGNEGADGCGAQLHTCDRNAWAPVAVVYDIHHHNPARKLLSERSESLPFGQHLC